MSRYLTALLLALLSQVAVAEDGAARVPLHIVYPQSESARDSRTFYPLDILRMALERCGHPFTMSPSVEDMVQSRSLRQLRAGDGVNVVWSVASEERDTALRRVPVPIDRGLIGWRVLLIRTGDAVRFRQIDSLAELGRLLGGQGHDWPDLPILRGNGLNVAESTSYDGLFAMLARGHIDYFPRGLSEVTRELQLHQDQPIELDTHLLLIYPSALYFFVNRDDATLAAALERGLELSIADGSLAARFEYEYGAVLAGIEKNRRVLRLENPELPLVALKEHAELWLHTPP